jgi:hypothetical protein
VVPELVVYANSITKTETDENGADIEYEILFMKGYMVFNVEQVDCIVPKHPRLEQLAGRPCDFQFRSVAICAPALPPGPTGCQYSVTFSEQPSVPKHACGCQKMRRAIGAVKDS